MGISCLLQSLKSIQTQISMSKYAGRTVGVDAYCWLHKGIHNCVNELSLNQPTTKCAFFSFSLFSLSSIPDWEKNFFFRFTVIDMLITAWNAWKCYRISMYAHSWYLTVIPYQLSFQRKLNVNSKVLLE